MNIFTKELYVAAYGQSTQFRLIKYAILIPSFAGIYWWRGGEFLAWALGAAAILALVVHFFYRYKTNAWTKEWGFFRPLEAIIDR